MSKKNSSVLNLNKILLSNQNLLNQYLLFKRNFKKFNKNRKFLVAVSGGPDSLALAAFCKAFSNENDIKFFFILVDHGIRKNSKTEALKVKKLLKKHKINLTILKNKVKIIKNIQSNARKARYNLMSIYCKRNGISKILTAHHSNDQIETFLIRLARGSGVQGLSSMKTVSKLESNIYIIRPLLDFKKSQLEKLSKRVFGKYFTDPSNQNLKFLRVKVRKLITSLERSGIHQNQIIKSIKNLRSSGDILNKYIKKNYDLNVTKKGKYFVINLLNLFKEPEEIQYKVISNVIQKCSKSYYPPRAEKVTYLINQVKLKKRTKFTLGKCVLEVKKGALKISKE
tara:strand:- start:503 stop:1522 length:1020 start_codon:yes stop_codon:yes gene_type:complete